MKNFKTICIILTTLIALFFIGKEINKVIPRYEWQESIVQTSCKGIVCDDLRKSIGLVNQENIVFCEWVDIIVYSEEEIIDINEKCGEDSIYENYTTEYEKKICVYPKTQEVSICHIKEKVRIN